MENLFIFLAVVQILVGAYLVYDGVKWLAYVRRRASTDPGFYSPRTAVLCPCKGVEPGLERNLSALCEFDHQNYEVFFILASESDPAASIVNRVASQAPGKAHVVVAGAAQDHLTVVMQLAGHARGRDGVSTNRIVEGAVLGQA